VEEIGVLMPKGRKRGTSTFGEDRREQLFLASLPLYFLSGLPEDRWWPHPIDKGSSALSPPILLTDTQKQGFATHLGIPQFSHIDP
jgi:hypothetical protein